MPLPFFDIYQRSQLTREALAGSGLDKRIAVTLFPEIAASRDPDREMLLESILLWFTTENRTYKRTYKARFDDFDAQVVRLLREGSWPSSKIEVHDAAVSDGRTAVDLFRSIDSLTRFDPAFLASDRDSDVLALSEPGSQLVAVVDSNSHALLQIIRPPFVLNNERQRFRQDRRLLRYALARTRVRALVRRLEEDDPTVRVDRISLFAPAFIELLETEPRFRFERHNLLDPMPRRFHLVRAMNILNRGYFSEVELRLAIANIRDTLMPGGIFATGSNEDAGSTVDGAIYERTDSGFRRRWMSGSGSQVDELITESTAG